MLFGDMVATLLLWSCSGRIVGCVIQHILVYALGYHSRSTSHM